MPACFSRLDKMQLAALLWLYRNVEISRGLFDSGVSFSRRSQFPQTPVKRGYFQVCLLKQFLQRQFSTFPQFHENCGIFRGLFDRATETNSARFCGGDSFGLSPAYGFSLVLREERKRSHTTGCPHF